MTICHHYTPPNHYGAKICHLVLFLFDRYAAAKLGVSLGKRGRSYMWQPMAQKKLRRSMWWRCIRDCYPFYFCLITKTKNHYELTSHFNLCCVYASKTIIWISDEHPDLKMLFVCVCFVGIAFCGRLYGNFKPCDLCIYLDGMFLKDKMLSLECFTMINHSDYIISHICFNPWCFLFVHICYALDEIFSLILELSLIRSISKS